MEGQQVKMEEKENRKLFDPIKKEEKGFDSKKEKELINPILEYFKSNTEKEESPFLELFEATDEDVDLRTDLSIQEIIIVNKIMHNCTFLTKKIKSSIYEDFIYQYLRLKISKDRKSRGEFVDINRREDMDHNLQKFSNFSNIAKVKE
jgi:hypothetical protein